MALVDLKNSPEDKQELAQEIDSPPDYSWGLRITLNADHLEKLGMDVTDFKVGSDVPASVMLRVCELEVHEGEGEAYAKRVGLIVTQIDLGTKSQSDADRAGKLYGGSE